MTRKFTQEEVANYFKEQGYKLLSEYKNVHSKVKVNNAKGEEYEVTLSGFKNGARPERKAVKFTQEEVAQYFKGYGYTLLSDYKGANEKVKIRNKKGEVYEVTLNGFKQGHRPENRLGDRYTQDEVANYFKERGYTLLSE